MRRAALRRFSLTKRRHGAGSRENNKRIFPPRQHQPTARRNLTKSCAAIRKSHARLSASIGEYVIIYDRRWFVSRPQNEIRDRLSSRLLGEKHLRRPPRKCIARTSKVKAVPETAAATWIPFAVCFTLTGRRRNIRRCRCCRRTNISLAQTTLRMRIVQSRSI